MVGKLFHILGEISSFGAWISLCMLHLLLREAEPGTPSSTPFRPEADNSPTMPREKGTLPALSALCLGLMLIRNHWRQSGIGKTETMSFYFAKRMTTGAAEWERTYANWQRVNT